jgi:tetratricopeptide (TPR) repeat protein
VITSSGVLEKMNLTFFKTNPRHELFSPLEVYNTALHEIGHTLGLMGHSDNPEDLMYASNDNSKNIYTLYRSDFQYLTSRDLKTLALLYRLEPTISNVKGLHSENFYYPPLIMGSEDARLFKKLEEYQKYIQKYPNFAAGYINIASIYVDMGDFDLALKALNSASNLAQNEDENYMVAYNRAIIYYNKRDYNNALNYAKQAKSIRPSNNIDELINDIDKIKNAS